MRVNHLLAKAYTGEHRQHFLFPLSTGQDWANKRVSGSDEGDGQRWPLGDALLSALIVAVIIICGRNCREAVRAYLQLSQKRTHSDEWSSALSEGDVMMAEEVEEVKGQRDHIHPLVLDCDQVDEFDGLDGIFKLHLNDKSIYDS